MTSAAANDGAQFRNVVTKDNTVSTVWADNANRSKTSEEWLEKNGLKSDIHQREPKGRLMPEAMSRANGRRSKVRSAVEHVFAKQKDKMKLSVRTIGISGAKVKIGMANIAYNILRYFCLTGKPQIAWCSLAERPECTPPRRQSSPKPTGRLPNSRAKW